MNRLALSRIIARDLVRRIIRFDGGAAWGDYPFWQGGDSIVRDFRASHPLPIRNARVEDEDGNVIWREGSGR
jgi:hypothetical protein